MSAGRDDEPHRLPALPQACFLRTYQDTPSIACFRLLRGKVPCLLFPAASSPRNPDFSNLLWGVRNQVLIAWQTGADCTMKWCWLYCKQVLFVFTPRCPAGISPTGFGVLIDYMVTHCYTGLTPCAKFCHPFGVRRLWQAYISAIRSLYKFMATIAYSQFVQCEILWQPLHIHHPFITRQNIVQQPLQRFIRLPQQAMNPEGVKEPSPGCQPRECPHWTIKRIGTPQPAGEVAHRQPRGVQPQCAIT